MTFEHIKGKDEAARILSTRLREELESDKRVLWLVSGGSNIDITIKTMELIRGIDMRRLTMMLTDERFGPVGHPDSNFQQLKAAGFMEGKATFIHTLANTTLEDTIRYYGEAAEKAFSQHDIVIGQFGIGDDGHIAGILPHSPAAMFDHRWAGGYEAPPLTRITLTPNALSNVHVAYAFVFGENKKAALESLRTKNVPLEELPSRVMKMIKESYVYSDQF